MAVPVVTELAEIQDDILKGRLIHCVGYAPSAGRRCHNPVNKDNRAIGTRLVNQASTMSGKPDDIREKLEDAAEALLCVKFHKPQYEIVGRAWYAELQSTKQRPTEHERAKRPSTKRNQQQIITDTPKSTSSSLASERDDSDVERVTVTVKARPPVRVVTTVEQIARRDDDDATPVVRQSFNQPQFNRDVQSPASRIPTMDELRAQCKELVEKTAEATAAMKGAAARDAARDAAHDERRRREEQRSRDAADAAREARIARMMADLEAREEKVRREEEQRSRNAVDAAREARFAQLASNLEAAIAKNERLQKEAEEKQRAADAAALDARLAKLESSISNPKTCRKSSSRPPEDQHLTPDAMALDRRLSQFESLMSSIMTTHAAKMERSSPVVPRSEESMLDAFRREQSNLWTALKASTPSKKNTRRPSLSISTDSGFDATGIYTPRSTGFSDFTATGIRTPPDTDHPDPRPVDLYSPSCTHYPNFKTAGICTPLSTEYAGSAASNVSVSTGTEDSYFTARTTPRFNRPDVEIPLSTQCDEPIPTGMLTPMSISYSDLTSAGVSTPSSTATDCHNVDETVRQSEELLREFAASMTKVLKVVSRNQKESNV